MNKGSVSRAGSDKLEAPDMAQHRRPIIVLCLFKEKKPHYLDYGKKKKVIKVPETHWVQVETISNPFLPPPPTFFSISACGTELCSGVGAARPPPPIPPSLCQGFTEQWMCR